MIFQAEQVCRAAEAKRLGLSQLAALKKELPRALEPFTENGFGSKKAESLQAVVYNMETGDRLDRITPYFLRHSILSGTDIILANELDYGMARSGNRNTTADLAETLNMNYVYGVEFITLDAWKNGNANGMHGNAILSKFPLSRAKLVHLPVEYDWFYKEGDPRLGMRNAVLAEVELNGQRVGICSVHLENRTAPAGRARQLAYLLDEIDAHFQGIPVLIGGDMNTNSIDGNDERGYDPLRNNPAEQKRRMGIVPELEPLMGLAASRGYDYKSCNLMDKETRRKPFPGEIDVAFNLDWFFTRGLKCEEPSVVESVFDHTQLRGGEAYAKYDGQLMSDHNAVVVRCRA